MINLYINDEVTSWEPMMPVDLPIHPCPFCGWLDMGIVYSSGDYMIKQKRVMFVAYVKCNSCLATGPAIAIKGHSCQKADFKAIKKWNRAGVSRGHHVN